MDDEPPHRPQTFADVLKRLAEVENELNPALELVEDGLAVAPAVQWYYTKSGQRHGPVGEDALKAMFTAGTLGPDDMVWRDGLPAWAAAKSVEGLVPKAATTGVRVRFYCPPQKAKEDNFLAGALNQMARLAQEREQFKVYVAGKLRSETTVYAGFDLTFEAGIGSVKVVVARWADNKEYDRKEFDLTFRKVGDYEVRFNFTLGFAMFGNSMRSSTVEVLKEPS
jgi:hypothetical protein